MPTTIQLANKDEVGELADLETTTQDSVVDAINEVNGDAVKKVSQTLTPSEKSTVRSNIDANVLKLDITSLSSLPSTVSNSAITSDMVVIEHTIATPSAQTSDWSWTTADGSITLSGSISGSTDLTLYLAHSV